MFVGAYASGFHVSDYHTEAANTAIVETIPGRNGQRLALVSLNYLAAATAHTLSVMHCGSLAGSRNTASVLALSGQKTITCTSAPTDPAGNAAATPDIIAFQLSDGTWEWDTVASIAGSVVTCTNNITGVDAGGGGTAILAGGKVRIFGVVGDLSYYGVHLTASVVTSFDNTLLVAAPFKGDPLYVSINNATNAGFLYNMVFAYINK